jgi:hypothetical protein
MKLSNVTRLTSAAKMLSHPLYKSAKSGHLPDARKLVLDILPKPYKFTHLKGKVCPVMKQSGNKIPLAMAEIFSLNSELKICSDVFLKPSAHSSTMIDRLHYLPEYTGVIKPGNYVILDDIYTSGSTLIALKHYLESQSGSVIAAYTLGSSKSTLFQPDRFMLHSLLSRFPGIDNYFDLNLLTSPQIVYLLRFHSIHSIQERYYQNCLALLYQ